MTLLSLTAVSAADYTVTGNSYDDIQNSVDVAGNNDRLLIGTGTYSSSGNAIEIDGKNITIQGQSNSNRAKLDGRGLYRTIIVQEDASLTLRYIDFVNGTSISYHTLNIRGSILVESCSFKNCYGDSGSAIYVFEDSNSAIIKDCTFINNHAANTGDNSYTVGGAVISQGSANFKVINCYFENNTALTYGGAIGLRNNGVGAEITNCTFVNNFAPDGGAIYALASATISGSTFRNNRATNNGGAIVTTGSNSLNIANSKFESNRAKNGGALYLTVLTRITGSSFSSNSATGNGGGLYTTGSSRSIISSSKFTSNSAKYGGGIYNNASLSISSSNFVSNKASANGGAIYANKNLNISGGNIKSNNANYGSGIYNLATLRVYKVYMSSNFAKVISITLKTPTEVKPSKKFTINVYLKTGDNIAGFIYNKNGNTYINGSRKLPLVYTPFKTFFSSIGASKNNIKSSSNGVATRTDTAGKSKFTVKVSYSQGGKTWSINKTVKVTSSAKNTKKTYTTKKSTNNKPVSKNNQSTTNVKSGTSIKVSLSNHEHAHLASLVNMDSYTINSKKISYWNLKKSTTLTRVTDYIYKVDKNGWYSGTINSKNGVSWKKLTKKPNKSGNWFNLTNTSGKYVIRNKVTQYTNDTSKNALMFFVSVKTSINHNSLIPYISYNYTLVNKNTKSKKTVRFFEKSDTSIYFIKNSDLPSSYNIYLKDVIYLKSFGSPTSLKDKTIRNLVISIIKKIDGEITPYKKANEIFKWVHNNIRYPSSSYSGTRYKALGTLSGKVGNCVDQTHLMVALLRSSGLPTKYLNYASCVFRSGLVTGHVFGIVYVNNKWYEFDTTGGSDNGLGIIKNVKSRSKAYGNLTNLNC